MSEPDLADALRRHPFTSGLTDEHIRRLAEAARSFDVAEGDFLAREGKPADALLLVRSGHVALATYLAERGAAPLQTVGAGDVVGWSWLVPPYRWQFDARAADAVSGLALDAGRLREWCEQDHELGYQLLRRLVAVIGSRLTAMRLQRADLYR